MSENKDPKNSEFFDYVSESKDPNKGKEIWGVKGFGRDSLMEHHLTARLYPWLDTFHITTSVFDEETGSILAKFHTSFDINDLLK